MDKDDEPASGKAGVSGRPSGPGPEVARRAEVAVGQTATAPIEIRRDIGRAQAVIDFIEQLIVPSGIGKGTRFKLRAFQKLFIHAIYEPHFQNGQVWNRIVRRAILSIARKNGKTALIAALVLCHLVGPEAVQNGEIYSAANDRDQAAQVFKMARQMVEAEPELMAVIRIIPSTKTLACYSNGSFYRAVSAEAGTKHGFNPTVVIYDELAQSKSRELYDVLDTSFGAQDEPLFVVISTQSQDPQHMLSQLIDDGLNSNDPTIVCHLYEVPDEQKDIFDPSCWKAANPALGDFRSYADFKALADKAMRMPAEEPKFRNLYLNQRVSPVTSLFTRAAWMSCAANDVRPCVFTPKEEVLLALDLSASLDLTALAMASNGMKETKLDCFMWKPKDFLDEHSDRDFGSGNKRYVEWHKKGFLLDTPGKAIDHDVIVQKIKELYEKYTVLGLAYDRWRIEDLKRAFERADFDVWVDNGAEEASGSGLRLIPWGQGFKDMAPAIDAFEAEITDGTLLHSANPLLTWTIGNAVATTDPAGNRKIDKSKTRFRIDPAVASTMVIGLKSRLRKKEDKSADISGWLANAVMR